MDRVPRYSLENDASLFPYKQQTPQRKSPPHVPPETRITPEEL